MRTLLVTLAALVAVPGLAAAAPTPNLKDLLGPSSGGPAAVGDAEPGAFVLLYPDGTCAGSRIGSALVGSAGTFSLPFTAPAADTTYSVKALDGFGMSACAPALTYHVVHDECPVTPNDRPVTRPPRSAIVSGVDYMPQFVNGDDPAGAPLSLWSSFHAAVQAEEPELVWFGGLGVFTHRFTGAVSGPPGNEILGGGSGGTVDSYMAPGPLSPALLAQRQEILQDYLGELRPYTRPGIYMDFGTQVHSNYVRSRGLWQFWTMWEAYDAEFQLGTKPPPPEEWLRTLWDVNAKWPAGGCVIPDNFIGLSHEYCPDLGGGWYRYVFNPLSEGFQIYWKMILEQSAIAGYGLAYLDNSFQHNCWNWECESGYHDWIAARYTPEEIDRYLRERTSALAGHGSFDLWKQENGEWKQDNGTAVAPYGNATIAPDVDAVRGRHSLRVESTDASGAAVVTLDIDGGPGVYHLAMQVRTTCATPSMYIMLFGLDGQALWDDTMPLPASTAWTHHFVEVEVPASGAFMPPRLNVHLRASDPGGCTLWADDVWIVPEGDEPGLPMRLWRTPIDDAAVHLRRSESMAYWDSIPDEVLPEIMVPARAVDSDYWLLTNSAKQRRGANAYFVERAMLERERPMIGPGSFPGTYTPVAGCTVDPLPKFQCDPADPDECSCLGGQPFQTTTTVDNVFDYKIANAYRFADEFAYHVHLVDRIDRHYIHGTASATLALAESAAFSGGSLVDLQVDSDYWTYGAVLGAVLRDLKIAYLDWAEAHPELFACLTSAAPIAIVWHDVVEDETALAGDAETALIVLANSLDDAGLAYDVISEKNLTAENLARYRAVIYQDLPRISEAEALMVADFLDGGGLVLASHKSGKFDHYYRHWAAFPAPLWPPVTPVTGQTVYPVGAGTFVYLPGQITGADVLAQRPELQTFPSLTAAQRATTRAAFWSTPSRTVAHVLNYSVPVDLINGGTPPVVPLSNVVVAIPTGAFVPSTATVHSPDGSSFQGSVAVSSSNGVSTVTLPSVAIHAVVLLE